MITRRLTTCFILISLLPLASCALFDSGPPPRIVRIKALADPKLREENPRWPQEVRDLIEAASDYFEGEFGIRLVTQAVEPWPLKDRIASTPALMERVKAEVPLRDRQRSYDLVIAFTGERVSVYFGGKGRVDHIGNCQEGLGNYLVSSVSAPFRYTGPDAELPPDLVVLIHELGHIFGASHVQDINSIMNEDFGYRTGFDKKNREIILRNKFCPFAKQTTDAKTDRGPQTNDR